MLWFISRVLLLLVVVIVGTALFMRIIGHDPAQWHVEPASVTLSGKPNEYLIAGRDAIRFDATPETVSTAFHEIATAEPGARLIAGNPDQGWMTYVVTSKLMGFPDYVSVRIVKTDTGSTLTAYSRARIGYSDMGVNRARLERWLASLNARTGK